MIVVIVYYTDHHNTLMLKKNADGQNMHPSLSDKHAALER